MGRRGRMGISIKNNFSKISIDIQGKCDKLKNMKPVMERIAKDMKKESDLNFRNSKGPDGVKWKELSTLTKTLRKNGGEKPLLDTGMNLKRNIHPYSTNTQAIIGTNVKFAPIHQFGGTIKPRKGKALKFGKNIRTSVIIPARPYLGVNQRMNEKYRKWVVEWIK